MMRNSHCLGERSREGADGLAAVLALCVALCFSPGVMGQTDAFSSAIARAHEVMKSGVVTDATEAFERAATAAEDDEERARAWFELANFLETRGRLKTASEFYGRIASIVPATGWNVVALPRAARVYQRLGKLDEALKAYESLASLPNAEPPAVQQALWGQLRIHQQIGNSDKAAAVARRIAREHPDSGYARQAASVIVSDLLGRGDFEAAWKLAEGEARRPNGNAYLLPLVVSGMRKSGDPDGALGAAELYLSLRPHDDSAYQMVYDIHRQRGTTGDYEKQLVAESQGEEKQAGALRRLADLYTREQKPTKALEALGRLVTLVPDDPGIPAAAGRAAMRLGQPDSAIEFYQRSLKLQPEQTSVRLELGDAYSEVNQREKAISEWKRATNYTPANPSSARVLGRRLHARGYYQDAVRTYEEVRQAGDEPGVLAAELGEAYESLLFIDKAVGEYLLAMRRPGAMASHARRRIRLLAGDDAVRPDVIAALQDAARADEAPEEALSALGFAYLKDGRIAEATQTLWAIPDPLRRSVVFFNTARELEQSGDTDAAAALYEAAAGLELPGDLTAQVALRLAALCEEQGDWRRARNVLAKASAQGPSPELAETVDLALADILVLSAGDFEGAALLYARVAEHGSTEESRRHAMWGLADCAFVGEAYPEAQRAYRELPALEISVEGPPAPPFGGGGMGFVLSWPPVEAAAPSRPMGRAYAAYQLAEIEFRSGNFKPAGEQFERLADDHPNSKYANDALERVLLISTEFIGASPAEAKYVEALRLLDRGEVEGASRILRMISSTGPDEALADDAAMLHAGGVARFGDRDEAAKEYAKIADRFPESPAAPEALLRAARIVARQPEARERALALFRTILTDFPESPEAGQAELGIDELLRK